MRCVTRNKLGFIEAPEIYLSGYRVYHAFHQCGKTVKYMMSGDNGAKIVSGSVIKKASQVNPHEA
ncbi:hypothetical protein EWF66_15845 [Salmonella enterica subsp. enterica]|nr:hypothetical protein [Salmonella enterica subsp. enterica]ECI7330211.1 hypothetical protein [Salmonella enterica subsp. enterica]